MASKVHRVRFYNPKPQPITCVSYNKAHKLIALARADASIEVWDLNKAPYLVRFIPGVENGSVEALGWVGERLLSTGLTGALVEWDIVKLTRKHSVLLTGYAAWCLDVNVESTLVAVGTEQGYINLYSVENGDIVYSKLFDKQEGRIMCCKFDKSGNTLVTDSIDTIRVWNVLTGHAMTRISVTRRQKEVVVWCVAMLSDNTIVSGDSQGRLTFWDSTVGEQIESYTTHKADVLSIAVSEDEKNIYCSGIDPIISHFIKIEKAQGHEVKTQWVKHVQRHIHEHDVRALLVTDGKLLSAGVDGYLTFSSYPPKWVMRVPHMIPTPRSSVCTKKKLLLLRYSNHLEVWKLGSYATSESGDLMINNIDPRESDDDKQNNDQIEQDTAVNEINKLANRGEKLSLKLIENPVKLVSIKSKHKKQIQCCAMSPSGEFIFYSSDSDVRMLKLDTDDLNDDQSNISVSKLYLAGLTGTCDRVAFTDDSRTMIMHSDGALHVLFIDPEAGATVIQTVTGNKMLKTTSIIHLLVSKKTPSGSTYIIVGDANGVIEVLVDNKKEFVPHITLPKYQCVPTAMTVDDEKETLIVVYSDQTILEYDLANKKVTGWPGGALPSEWLARTSAVTSVSVHPRRRALVCQDETSLWILDRSKQSEEMEPIVKRKPAAPKTIGFNVIPIKYLTGFHWLDTDEAVLLEVLPENIVSQLPAPVQVNRWS
ncbi:U3 small nucleolar RNA-associated protein 4 homolog [Pectinophora gossypiella]|uniref:U3 small nucleolar RNA-associated protein 4 homolog n=1 Tax=Pectinophora gossypiella TaxID=13191 RepID=UPI00214E691E|nr:U3 small nucleolar RNA-associated protein 4 homolog [Pectinophora gossypiella]